MPGHRISLNPATEKLFSKLTDLEETLEGIEGHTLTPEQKHAVKICRTYLLKAREFIERPFWILKFPFVQSRHPHLVWELLHRVDEYILLLSRKEEMPSKAIDIRNSFDLNIAEDKLREKWLGDKGKLNTVIGNFDKDKDQMEDRYVLKDALRLINERMDRTFWQLSANTLTTVYSGVLLGLLILLAWKFSGTDSFKPLADGCLSQSFTTLFILGLMGAYLSNLITKDDFLYIRGGPYWRYFFLHLFSKPVLSGFAAIFIFILAQSKLIFAIGPASEAAKPTSQIININVSAGAEGYAFAILAVISGFAADKVLRNMIDAVLKKLEQKAEKTKDTGKK